MRAGERYGAWTILSDPFEKGNQGKRRRIRARCDCGTEKVVDVSNLRSRKSRSCGCAQRKHSTRGRIYHGLSDTRLYKIWRAMVRRCMNPNSPGYGGYGGRGITVCEEWLDFPSFCKWAMGSGYSDVLELDRVDTNKGYCPGNCRFTTRTIQCQNRRKQSNNTSGYIGVSLSKRTGRFRAEAWPSGSHVVLGEFDTAIEAAKVRDAFVSKHYDSPTLNF